MPRPDPAPAGAGRPEGYGTTRFRLGDAALFPPPPVPVPPGRGGPQVIPRPDGARPGAPAPWHGADLSRARRAADVAATVAAGGPPVASPRELDGVTAGASAVLVALYDHDGEAHVVLTRRTWDLRSHQGEVSFPGGRRDPGDVDLAATALREAHEEVGLDPAAVRLVGELDHLATITSNSAIVPYVGVLEGRPELVANPGEVDEVLHVPLSELLTPGVFREERWPVMGAHRRIFFFELEADTVWGATGAMLRQLLGFATGTLGRGQLDHL